MNEVSGITIFLPYKVLDGLSCANLFGHCNQNKSQIIINCTLSVNTGRNLNDILHFHKFTNEEIKLGSELQFLGIIYASKKKLKIFPLALENYYQNLWFILRVDILNNSFHLEELHSKHDYSYNFVLYDSFELMNSYYLVCSIDQDHQKNLILFLTSSLNNSRQFCSYFSDKNYVPQSFTFDKNDDICYLPCISSFDSAILCLNKTWCFKSLLKLIRLSHVGRQIHQRVLDTKIIFSVIVEDTEGTVDFKRKNLMFSILFDAICGWLITFFILKLDLPELFLENTIHHTNNIVNGLQKLIYWLMGVPAGLKLNIPLNSALGHFFLYHIYLWEAYMTIILPVFHVVLKIATVIGAFGLTFILSLLSDVISLATVHIYCFYGYATRLYGYQISCLSALWRLFRGKKWNPLRQRVDSYSYDVHQLYLGTLLFTVLLFLLPTVFVYYLVFMTLRILVLTVQGLMSKCIEILSILPLYSITLRMFNSPITNGAISFSVFSSKASLVLCMQLIQAPFSSVIRNTLPDIHKCEKSFSWKELISNIITGDIIYPL